MRIGLDSVHLIDRLQVRVRPHVTASRARPRGRHGVESDFLCAVKELYITMDRTQSRLRHKTVHLDLLMRKERHFKIPRELRKVGVLRWLGQAHVRKHRFDDTAGLNTTGWIASRRVR